MLHRRQLDTLDRTHVEALVAAGTREDTTLDFKIRLPDFGGRERDKAKRDLLVDVASFANGDGGDIVFGVGESEGSAASLDGIEIPDMDSLERQWIEIIEQGLDPRLTPKVRFRQILLDGGRAILVLRVPRSLAAPHMVKDIGRFYARKGAANLPLDAAELRRTFLRSEEWAVRARRFRDLRVLRILAGETPVTLKAPANMIVHAVPLASAVLDLHAAKDTRPVEFGLSYGPRFNLDGLVVAVDSDKDGAWGYVQFLRDGSLEVVHPIDPSTREGVVFPRDIEEHVLKAAAGYLPRLATAGVTFPIAVMVTLAGVAGRAAAFGGATPFEREGLRIRENVVTLSDVVLEEFPAALAALPAIFQPTFDMLWQAFGIERSRSYDRAGKWKSERP